MALPDVTITVSDGALGLAETSGNLHAKLGLSSGGTANTVYSFGDIAVAKATLLAGPLLEDVAFHLATAGGPVLAVPVTPSNAGTIGSVTLTGTGVTPGASATGTPRDKYDVVVKIIAGGAVATASFQVSFDGGVTFSPTTATAASITTYVASTGLTLTFAAGTYVANDLYKFSTVAPTYSSSDLNTAIDALLADARDVAFIHVVGTTGGADDAAKITSFVALCTAVATKMATAETAKRWEFAIMEAPEITEGAWAASATWNAFASTRISPALGRVTIQSQVSSRQTTRSLGTPYAARLASIPVQEHPGKAARGPLPGIVSMSRDERSTPGGDAARFTTARTFPRRHGYYLTNGRTAASAGSDFVKIMNRRVIDKACRSADSALFQFLNVDLRVNADDGTIFEADARNIEAAVDAALTADLVATGNASSVSSVVNRSSNVLSTETIPVTIRIVPKGYASFITADVGLLNPALQVV